MVVKMDWKLSKERGKRERKKARWESGGKKYDPDNMDEGRPRPQGGGREGREGMWTKPAAGCVRNNNCSFNSIRCSFRDTTDPTVHVTRNNNLK